jgi:hypothetical protein
VDTTFPTTLGGVEQEGDPTEETFGSAIVLGAASGGKVNWIGESTGRVDGFNDNFISGSLINAAAELSWEDGPPKLSDFGAIAVGKAFKARAVSILWAAGLAMGSGLGGKVPDFEGIEELKDKLFEVAGMVI